MEMKNASPATIDEYIKDFPDDVQEKLRSVRETIRAAAPDAVEKIAWRMPTFYQCGNLIHFAAFKRHIGIFPGVSGIEHFRDEFKSLGLQFSKGAVQLPFDRPMPLDLVARIVRFRVIENTAGEK